MKLNYFKWAPSEVTSPGGKVAPSLVFLHGLGGTGAMWRSLAVGLETRFECIALDQRGHGLSRKIQENDLNFRAIDYANDVIETLASLNITSTILIGHSMGVRTALATAHRLPSLVQKIVAIDMGISSVWGGGIGLPLAQFLETLPETFPDRTSLRDYLLKTCPDESIARYLAAVAVKSGENPEIWSFPFDHQALIQTIHQAKNTPVEDWVKEILESKIPMAFLRGENSKVWLKEDYESQKLRFKHPLLHFEEWKNCGHGLPFEQRAKLIQFISEFVQKTPD